MKDVDASSGEADEGGVVFLPSGAFAVVVGAMSISARSRRAGRASRGSGSGPWAARLGFDTGRGLVPRPEAGLNQRGPGKPGPTNPLMQLDGAGDSCDEALTFLEETVGDAASDNSAPPDVWTQPTLRGGHPARAAVPDPGADVAGDQRARRLPCASGQRVRGGLPRQDGRHDT